MKPTNTVGASNPRKQRLEHRIAALEAASTKSVPTSKRMINCSTNA